MALLRRDVLLGTCLAVALPAVSLARRHVPPEVQAEMPAARLVGQGTLRFLGLRIYDAALWAEAPLTEGDWFERRFALELDYARALVGKSIAQRSLDEMKRQGEIAADQADRWLAAMQRLFPDVKAGDRLTGIKLPGVASHFFFNGQVLGAVADPHFTRKFFGIWLARETSQPALRMALLGQSKAPA